MNNLPNSITKRILWRYVNKIINHNIHHYHVYSVINILFEEIITSLKEGNSLDIFNFGSLILKKLPSRKYYDVCDRKIKTSKSHKILRFNLNHKFRNKICNYIKI